MIKKIIFSILIAFASLVLIVALAIFSILNWPGIILNTYTLEKALPYIEDFGYKIEYKDATLKAKAMGFLDDRITIHFDDICVTSDKEPLKKACFDLIDLSFRYNLGWMKARLLEIGPITINGATIALQTTKSADKEEKKSDGPIEIPDLSLPKFLKKTHFNPIAISIKNFSYKEPSETISGNVDIKTEINDNRLNDLLTNLKIHMSGSKMTITLKGKVSSESGFRKDDANLKTDIQVSGPGKTITGKFNLQKDSTKKVNLDGSVSLKQQGLNLSSTIKGSISPNHIDATIGMDAHQSVGFGVRVGTKACSIKLKRIHLKKNDGKLDLHCPITATLSPIHLPDEIDHIYKTPEVINLTVSGNLNTFFMLDMDHPTSGKISLRLASASSYLVETQGKMDINVKGRPSQFPHGMSLASNMDISFKVHDFQRLVTVLDNTKFPVPAPFAVLHGPLSFSLKGDVPSLSAMSHFPAEFKSELKAEKERLFINAKGKADFGLRLGEVSSIDLEMKAELEDVVIVLPSIGLASLPRLTPDGRIQLEAKKEKKKELDHIKHDITITTPKDSPIKIVSNLAKQPIPIHVNIKSTDESLSGLISIDQFDANLFSRKAHIDHLDFHLADPMKNSVIDAKIAINVTEYDVYILIKGLIDRPNIWFESKPPLSEDSIVSLLLYGETLDDLDEDYAQSVGSMKAAMANKAMAITTFFLFASTPIQSVAYNPETKAVTARIKLGTHTSLMLGSDSDKNKSLGIRRRLGGGWMITTSVSQDVQEDTTVGTAYIEWHKRY